MNLVLTPQMMENVHFKLGNHGLCLSERSLSGRLTLFRQSQQRRPNIVPSRTILELSPEDAVMLGLFIMLKFGQRCPDFMREHFQLEIQPESEVPQ